MAQTKRISRILIAEGNLFFRRGLSSLFAADAAFSVVGEVSTFAGILPKVQEAQPNVLVIDSALLNQAGLAFDVALRQANPNLAILVLAATDSEQALTRAIEAGAKGYLLKSTSPADLVAALGNVAFGEGGMNKSGLLPELAALARQTSILKDASVLTAREIEVLKLLAEGKTVRVVANDLSLSMKTVEAHKLNLMRKLDIHDRASLVAYATRNELVGSADLARSLSCV